MAGYCRDCFTGTVQPDAAPLGTEQTLHNLPTYVTTPPSSSSSPAAGGIIIIITDAFGWTFPNTRSLADAYARRTNCIVYMPDFMSGTALPIPIIALLEYSPPQTDLLPLRLLKRAWSLAQTAPSFARFAIGSRHSAAQKRIRTFLSAVHETTPGAKVGVAGFCWGGRFVVELTHHVPENRIPGEEGRWLIDCAFTAHPSLVAIPGDVDKVVVPLSVANGEDDEWMGRDKFNVLRGVMDAKNEAAGREVHEVVVYPGARHGFAVRRDWTEERQREVRDRCEDQAVAWFRRHLVDS